MSCATFNVAVSLNLHGWNKNAVSKSLGFGHHTTFQKFSSLFFETLGLSSTNRSFVQHAPSRSFHSVFKCAAQNSQPSPSIGIGTENNSRKHCRYSIYTFLSLYCNIIYFHYGFQGLCPSLIPALFNGHINVTCSFLCGSENLRRDFVL